MKITSQIAAAALVLGLMSCSDAGKENTTATTAAPAATAPAATQNQAVMPAKAVALNPPHGEPNHRCDIEVGAPLDSPPKPNLSAPLPQPAFNPSTSTQTVAPGTNPPHGQPGHDCGIPVGAPLTKK